MNDGAFATSVNPSVDKLRNIIPPHSVRGLSSDVHVRSEDYGILVDVHRVSYERMNGVLFFSHSFMMHWEIGIDAHTMLFAFANIAFHGPNFN